MDKKNGLEPEQNIYRNREKMYWMKNIEKSKESKQKVKIKF